MQPNSWAGSRQSVCRGQQSARRHYRSTGTIATGGSCNPDPRWGHKTPTSHPLRAASGSSSEGPALLRQHNRCNSTNSGSNGSGRGSSSSTWAPFGVQRGRSTPGVARGHGGAPAGATTRQLLSSPAPGASPAPPFITSSWPALQPPFSYLVRWTGTKRRVAGYRYVLLQPCACVMRGRGAVARRADGTVVARMLVCSGMPCTGVRPLRVVRTTGADDHWTRWRFGVAYVSPSHVHTRRLLWSSQATAEDAISNSVPCGLPPLWKVSFPWQPLRGPLPLIGHSVASYLPCNMLLCPPVCLSTHSFHQLPGKRARGLDARGTCCSGMCRTVSLPRSCILSQGGRLGSSQLARVHVGPRRPEQSAVRLISCYVAVPMCLPGPVHRHGAASLHRCRTRPGAVHTIHGLTPAG